MIAESKKKKRDKMLDLEEAEAKTLELDTKWKEMHFNEKEGSTFHKARTDSHNKQAV